jgi:hypothetical protein
MKLQKREKNPEKRQEKLAERSILQHRKEIRDRKYHVIDDEEEAELEILAQYLKGNKGKL